MLAVAMAWPATFAVPTAATGCAAGGEPTTTVYLPNITKTLGGPTGWVTPFVVQNVGASTTTLEISFYRFSDGELVTCRGITGLLPGTSYADVPNNDVDLPDDSQFSVVVRSFGSQVVSVVNQHQGVGARAEALSYTGFETGATRLGLPWVAKWIAGWLTTFVIQNIGSAQASVTATFASADGSATATLVRSIAPGRSAVVDPSVEAELPAGAAYAVVLSSDQPIGAVANAHNDSPTTLAPMAFSYNGIAATDQVYVPWVGRNVEGGLRSTVVVQNLGTSDAAPTLTFRRLGAEGEVVVRPGTIRPGRALEVALPPATAACPAAGSASCPGEGEHSLVVTGGTFAALAQAIGPSSAMGIVGGATARSRVYLPNITRTLGGPSGWTTPVVIQSAGMTTGTARWYRFSDGGLEVTQYVSGLTAGTSVKLDPRAVPGLSDATQYSVVVDGNGPLRAVVLELSSLGGDGAMAYEGFTAAGVLTPAPVVAWLAVNPSATGVTVGGTTQLAAAARDQFGSTVVGVPVTWSVSPAGIGTLSATGLFTSSGQTGTGTVTAKYGGLSASATLTIAEQTTTVGGFTFGVSATASADVYTESGITTSDAQMIATAVDADVLGVQATYGRAFSMRPPVYVFATTASYTTGLETVLGLSASDATTSGPQTTGFFRWTSGPQGITNRVALNWEKESLEEPATTPRHELTHMMIQQIAKETEANPIPAWLHEGSARVEEFAIVGTQYWQMRNRYTAASMVAVRDSFAIDDLMSQDLWNARTGTAAFAQYYQASQIVQLLRADIGSAGVIRIFELMGQGQTFETAFGAVAGRTYASFASGVPSRLQAISQYYPGLATAPDEPGREGLSYIAYGFAPNSSIRIDIVGRLKRYENSVKTWVVDEYGTRFVYFGPSWPADTYSFTVTGLTSPSSDQPNTTVTIRATAVKAASVEGFSITW